MSNSVPENVPPGACMLDHGAVGNGKILALIAPTGAVEWLCMPRFDAPSVFGRIIDREKGGGFSFHAPDEELEGELSYLPNTNVLVTRFERDNEAWEIVDFCPRLPDGHGWHTPPRLVRLVRPLRGHPLLRANFDFRPEYASETPAMWEGPRSLDIRWSQGRVTLTTSVPISYVRSQRTFILDKPQFFVLDWGPTETTPTLAGLQQDLESTVAGWRAWSKTCALPSFAPDVVLRSALVLKLHAYEDTGAIIAAATTSIPEALGTPRTWDYRYCWLRDAAFVVEALRRLSHLNEGERFMRFLRNVAEAGPLQPLYAIDGGRDATERTLDYLAGFEGTGPVRIGNAAVDQKQNDLCGELVLSIDALLGDPRVDPAAVEGMFPLVCRLVEEAILNAPTLDTGIWEFRTLLRHYTFSRVMCWAAVHRGARIAQRLGHTAEAERWMKIADAEHAEIMRRAYNEKKGFFTQALDGEQPDASNLLLPAIGFIDARDERFTSTLREYERLLVRDGLMLRYRNDDDFGETTSAFTICSFWWAEALALAGRLDEAAAVFQRVAAHGNGVGLFSEDVDPITGRRLGNFPQAYTHVGAVHAAMTIGALLDARDGRVRAWA